jgi:tRNA 2-selenouridine synthase
MAIEKIHIDRFLELAKQNPVIDVRSPGEFNHAHLPGAYSMPLFTDEERKIVGTAYKQESREQAIKIGLDFFGPKMRKMVEEVESLIKPQGQVINEKSNGSNIQVNTSRTILVYCWRGGMRSAGVAWLLDLYGFKVYTLIGGYKKFRHYVLDTFKLPYQFKIIGGYTGSGKTYLLKELQRRGEPVVDLEEIATHKGSAFGNIGLPPQPGQEMFENLLASKLREVGGFPTSDLRPPIWLEDESQRIGLVNLPNELWKNMRQSRLYFLDIPFEERLKHIVQEYGELNREQVIEAIGRISEKLGHLNAKTAILMLFEGKITESFEILLKYYDKYYLKGLHNREGLNSLLSTIECKSVTPENASLLEAQTEYQPEKL